MLAGQYQCPGIKLMIAVCANPVEDAPDLVQGLGRERDWRAAETAVSLAGAAHSPSVALAVGMGSFIGGFGSIMSDAFLFGEVHEWRPAAQVVDEREPATSAQCPRGSFLASQVQTLLATLTALLLAPERLRFGLERRGVPSFGSAFSLLLFRQFSPRHRSGGDAVTDYSGDLVGDFRNSAGGRGAGNLVRKGRRLLLDLVLQYLVPDRQHALLPGNG